jgi:pimeloyl-ACP methyl ester carboxylesterase
MAAVQGRTFSFLSAGIVIVVMISGVSIAQSPSAAPAGDKSIRPFHVNVPEAALIYYNKLDKGGHFAAWEQPELFSQELRAAFKSMR